MSDLSELYQQVILDHSKNPHNHHEMDCASRSVDGHNPLCGDKIHVYVKLKDDIIKDISFVGQGCAISQSSASIMTTMVKGKRIVEAEKLIELFHDVVTGKVDAEESMETLGKLSVFAGVKNYPSRIKCASLSWHTLKNALKNETAVTE